MLRERQVDREEAVLVGRLGGFRVDLFVQLHPALEEAVVDLDVLVEAPVAGRARRRPADDEDAVDDRDVDLVRVDARRARTTTVIAGGSSVR